MTNSASAALDSKPQLLKTMGFWDVLLFNIATVLGPRWIAAAGHNGTSSISLWVIAAALFFSIFARTSGEVGLMEQPEGARAKRKQASLAEKQVYTWMRLPL